MIGLGLGLARRGNGGPKGLPAGAIGVWFASDYSTANRQAIPNALGTKATDKNIMTGPRRVFSATSGAAKFWFCANCTSTDCAVAAPDGSTEATTIVSSPATFWSVYQNTYLTPGTYTLCLSIKDIGSDTNQLVMGQLFVAEATKTISSSWQRLTYTFTVGSTGQAGVGIRASGSGSLANFAIADVELFAGSADLNPAPLTAKPKRISNGDIILGKYNGQTVTVSSGEVVFDSLSALQLPTEQTPAGLTIMFTGKRRGTTIQAWDTLLTQVDVTGKTYDTFAFGQNVTGGPDIRLAGSFGTTQGNDGLFGGCGARHTFAITYTATSEVWYINGAQVCTFARSTAIPALRDLFVGSLDGVNSFSSYNMGSLAIWPRALSASEILDAMNVIEKNQTMPAKRLVILEGDSITAQQTARVGFYTTKPAFGWDHAIAGAGISGANSLNGRAAMVDAVGASAPSGTTKILTVLIGANDLFGAASVASWLSELSTYLDARRAAGWKVVLCTVLPQDGATTFNSRRATANTTLRTWVGSHCDAIADYAADATMGPDNSRSVNPSRWYDGVHPNASGHDILAPILAAAIDTIT